MMKLSRSSTRVLGVVFAALAAATCGQVDPSEEDGLGRTEEALTISCHFLFCGAQCHFGAVRGFCNAQKQCVPEGTPLFCHGGRPDGGFGGGPDGSIGGGGAEFINHGCAPNLVARFDHGRVFLLSVRAIAKGEELLFDYRVRGDIDPIPCRCGAPECRGFLNEPQSC